MFRTLLDPAPFSSTLSTPTSSSLLFPPNRKNPCAPQSGLSLGRFAEQSPLTGYEPNALVEVSSTKVTTTLTFKESKHWIDLQLQRGHRHLPLMCRRWMKDQILECWPHHR